MATKLRYASPTEEAADVRLKRKALLHSLRTHLIPVLVQQGFESISKISHGAVDREYKETFPFGSFVRNRQCSVDFIEIQMAPHRADFFRINAGRRSSNGLVTENSDPASDALLGTWTRKFEMLARPKLWGFWWWSWFTVRTWFRDPGPADYDKLAMRVAGYLAELELAFERDQLGPHLRRAWIPPAISKK